MKTENELVKLAETHPSDNVANKAMKELRERLDFSQLSVGDKVEVRFDFYPIPQTAV